MADNPVIDVRDVWVRYGEIPALESIHLVVARHDFLGIIGPNGGGKSTLLRVVLGLITPDSGT
ncbi:MAG: ATP-binding cassette domain-containing protein, partial [Dehalococcoidia bacterium]